MKNLGSSSKVNKLHVKSWVQIITMYDFTMIKYKFNIVKFQSLYFKTYRY